MIKDEVTAFQLGSSIVVTLPKELGIKPGQKMKIEAKQGNIILKRKKKNREEEIRKFVRSLAVGLRLKSNLTPEEIKEELDRRYEERYEKMLS
ncbi:AbrB/MazE/SpoVT family DNA-binding domain-containing protein [Candidatus Daviesbacteria bacterium]|nr:AbrB/MazE/SpoVT family DNA-binding domain-containing protein [Candidatus Daviesbacteria bacterium]